MAAARKNASISRKLTVAIAIAVGFATLPVTGLSAVREASRRLEGKFESLQSTASVFASASSPAMALHDRARAFSVLRAVARAPYVVYARIDTPDGALFVELGSGVRLSSDAGLNGADTPSLRGALTSRTLSVTAPIAQNGRVVGKITLVADNSDFAPQFWGALARSALIASAAVAMALLIAAGLKRAIIRPLLSLTAAVRRIGQGEDPDGVAVESDDEVGELCTGVNVMLAKIRERERRIADLAFVDGDTRLPNRHAFERSMAARLENAQGAMAVAAVRVDRFQYLRSLIGPAPAHDLLAQIGARAAEIGPTARLGDDILAVALEAGDADAIRQRASALLLQVEEPVALGDNTIEADISIGLAVAGVHGEEPSALIERATIALDQGKAAGKKTHAFDVAAFEDTTRNMSLMADMITALGDGQMAIFVQPKFDVRAGAVMSGEVLTRWRHPERGMVAPDLFISMAEEAGAISLLTEWTIRQTLACQSRLVAAGLPGALAVNLSGRLLGDRNFTQNAMRMIERRSADLFLEITETATIDSGDRALQNLEMLRAAGAMISIDDYGSGLSSLSYLKRIPAQELKIDKAFVQLLGKEPRDGLMVKSTIDLAHALGMKVTAEGVEDETALAALQAMGCDSVQGYLIGRPMPVDAYFAYLRSGAVRAA